MGPLVQPRPALAAAEGVGRGVTEAELQPRVAGKERSPGRGGELEVAAPHVGIFSRYVDRQGQKSGQWAGLDLSSGTQV